MSTFMLGVLAVFGLSTLAFLFLMWRAQSLDDEGPAGVKRAKRVQ